MGIFAGRDSKGQIGKETTWGTAVAPTVVLDMTSEGLELVRDNKKEDVLIGRKFTRGHDTMGTKVSGPISVIMKPDSSGILLGCTLGAEATAALQSNVAEVTEITCTAEVAGSLEETYFYLSSPSVNYYAWFDLADGSADPSIAGRTGIEVNITTGMTAAQVAAQVATAINAVATFAATATSAVVTTTCATAGLSTDPSDAGSSGCTFKITTDGYGAIATAASSYQHVFTPLAGGTTSSLPSFTFVVDRKVDVHGYVSLKVDSMSLDAALNEYLRATFNCVGYNEQDDALESLTASTLKAFTFKGGKVLMNNYVAGYVTGFRLNYQNSIENDRFVMDGTDKMIEIEPQDRICTAEFDVVYDADVESIRDSYFKTGSTVSVDVYFETTDAIETGYYYFLRIQIPNGFITEDPKPNVQGPGRITAKLMIEATQPGAAEAVTITLGDASSSDYIN